MILIGIKKVRQK